MFKQQQISELQRAINWEKLAVAAAPIMVTQHIS